MGKFSAAAARQQVINIFTNRGMFESGHTQLAWHYERRMGKTPRSLEQTDRLC